MEVVVIDQGGEFECHKVGCRDLTKKKGHSWIEDSIEEAEESFNWDLGVEAGYDPPWVWADHVKVYPCAKEG